jgi:hypothetical protein
MTLLDCQGERAFQSGPSFRAFREGSGIEGASDLGLTPPKQSRSLRPDPPASPNAGGAAEVSRPLRPGKTHQGKSRSTGGATHPAHGIAIPATFWPRFPNFVAKCLYRRLPSPVHRIRVSRRIDFAARGITNSPQIARQR